MSKSYSRKKHERCGGFVNLAGFFFVWKRFFFLLPESVLILAENVVTCQHGVSAPMELAVVLSRWEMVYRGWIDIIRC